MGLEESTRQGSTSSEVLDLLKRQFPDGVVETALPQGDATAVVSREALFSIMTFLKNDPALRFNVLADATAVDYLGRSPRFQIVYNLLSLPHNRRLRIKVQVEDGVTLDSLTSLWAAANWLEREIWDMFGIRFEGHPDLRRILLYEEFQGHALRKDYPIRKRQPLIGPKD